MGPQRICEEDLPTAKSYLSEGSGPINTRPQTGQGMEASGVCGFFLQFLPETLAYVKSSSVRRTQVPREEKNILVAQDMRLPDTPPLAYCIKC